MTAAPIVHRAADTGGHLPVANVFPPVVRDALVRASLTPVEGENDNARQVAIDEAVKRARTTHPHLFR